ncbi:MAG: ATP-binding protein [Oscillospiraceae bacterium]
MKKLTRLLLVNWHYFQNTVIDFGNINFLTGKNSAGKSTIIDALQVVLMGETRSVAFNRAASKKSERTLKSYLIGSMGEDIENGNKSLRDGKDFSTYIVAEFYDDFKSAYFCLGAVFDTFADGSDINKRFFWLKSNIPENRFIENGKTMDSRRMTQFFKEKYPNKFETKDTSEGYRRIVLEKLNIHDENFISMLKKAISFEPINDIEKFITENVCDIEDDIDIVSMQDNILYYKQQEAMAQRFEGKLSKLEEICGRYSEIEKLRSRRKIQQFLIDYGTYNSHCLDLEKAQADLTKYNDDIEEFEQKKSELEKLKIQLDSEYTQLINEKAKYRIENKIDVLEAEEKHYTQAIADHDRSISAFVTNIKTESIRWCGKFSNCIEKLEDEDTIEEIKAVISYLQRTEKFSEEDFELLSPKYFSKIREAYINAKNSIDTIASELAAGIKELKEKKSGLERQIEQLQNGIMPYPPKAEKLKQVICDELKKKYGSDISVDFLADKIEIIDEEWHNAVEGYLNTQRMNIIVPPEYFMDAYQIYKKVRDNEKIFEFAIVDLQKVYEDAPKPMQNSLAEIVKSEDKYVQAYIDFLLGKVIRCYSDDKIRDFRTSVTKDCMLYHNYAVKPLNPRAYEFPYIGRNSIEIQIAKTKQQLEEKNAELMHKSEINSAVVPVVSGEWFLTENYISLAVVSAFNNYENRNECKEKLLEIQQTLDKINFLWLEEMDKKISAKKAEIDSAVKEKEDTIQFISDYKHERDDTFSRIIPELEQKISEIKSKIDIEYSEEYRNNEGIPRYKTELAECGSPNAVADKFNSPVKGTISLIATGEKELVEKRNEYNRLEQASFRVSDVNNNDEYDEAYRKIRDYELPNYREKIEKAKNDAMEQFKSDFIYKLRANIQSAEMKIDDLNEALKIAQFGNDKYRFSVEPNPAYIEYYNMLMSSLLDDGTEGLFSYNFTEKYKTVIDNLFEQIISFDSNSEKSVQSVKMFSKYQTYLTFDLITTDSSGRREKLSKSINTKSGGETQTPFYIAVLASFARLYRTNDLKETGNTMRLVIFDEAFNKMDGERIVESVKLLRNFGLQAIICSPPEKASDIAPIADKTQLVYKEAVGDVYRSTVVEWTKEMSEING